MIDEFQFLFGERDAVTNEAVQLLEDVARRGRTQGIHLVLASQDVSGIEAFWCRPAIFEQFVLRIGLPRARRVLTETQRRDDAPAALARRGQPRVGGPARQRDRAHPGRDRQGEPSTRCWRRLHEMEPAARKQPRLFDGGRAPARGRADSRRLTSGDRPPAPLVGQCMTWTAAPPPSPMPASPGRNIGVLGRRHATPRRARPAAAVAGACSTTAAAGPASCSHRS